MEAHQRSRSREVFAAKAEGIICKSLPRVVFFPSVRAVIPSRLPFFYYSGAPVPLNTGFYWSLWCKGLEERRAGQDRGGYWKESERLVQHEALTASGQVRGRSCHGNCSWCWQKAPKRALLLFLTTRLLQVAGNPAGRSCLGRGGRWGDDDATGVERCKHR